MSLINQALKLEQQKRHEANAPVAPMVSHRAHRGQNDKLPLLLFGFTGMGMLLAASVTAIFYFGSDFLNTEKGLAASATPQQVESVSPQQAAEMPHEEQASPKIEDLLSTLSQDQLSTVQKMLLEKEAATSSSRETATLGKKDLSESSREAPNFSEISRMQGIVDTFNVQGIRKSGQETRVFLNGKIRRIGDIVDIENRLQLIGFTETALVFRTENGQRFEKAL